MTSSVHYQPTPSNPLLTKTYDTTKSNLEPQSPKKQSFGSKFDNCMRLKEFVEQFEDVDVPFSFGISTEEAEEKLKEQNSRFFTLHDQLKRLYDRYQPPQSFLNDPETLPLLEELQKEIIEGFKKISFENKWKPFITPTTDLMSRSSGGGEDGVRSKAGIHLSLSYILPPNIAEALGQSVASYYSKKALEADIQAGVKLFESYHLSAFAQELIGEVMGGEPDPNDIPTSGVLFNNEPLYTQGQKFSITRISGTPGQGEAVVGAGFGTDTVLALKGRSSDDLYVLYQNQPKPERLAPVDGTLQVVANPEELVNKCCLSDELIKRLYQIGQAASEQLFAGNPVDIEFVIKKGIIYLVQARPINRAITEDATYLDLEQSNLKTTEMEVVVPGHYKAFVTDSLEGILFVDSLSQAPFKPHKLIVFKEPEPANSHPVVLFSEPGIETPCFRYDEEGITLNSDEVLAVCPQQGIVATGPAQAAVLKKGYIDHPVSLDFATSLPFVASDNIKEVLELFKQMRITSSVQQALDLLERLKPFLDKFTHQISLTPTFSEEALKLQKIATRTFNELSASLKSGPRLEVLFYAKVLRTLFTKGAFSVLSLTEALTQAAAYEKEFPGRATLAEAIFIPALLKETGEAWKQFLMDIEPLDKKQKLLELLHGLGSLKPLWLTFYFAPQRQEVRSSEALLDLLLGDLDADSQDLLNYLPKHIGSASARLLESFTTEKFNQAFSKAKPLARLVALNFLNQAVTAYDRYLKSIKRDASLQDQARVQKFKNALTPFTTLSEKIARNLVGGMKLNMGLDNSRTGLNSYFEFFNEHFATAMKEPNVISLLHPSPEFDARLVQLGNGVTVTRHPIHTLEEVFNTAHRNLEVCLCQQFQENLSPPSGAYLPSLLVQAVERLKAFDNARHMGIEGTGDGLIYHFTLPLRDHSSTAQLFFNAQGTLQLSAQLLGQARFRWDLTLTFFKILQELGVHQMKKLVHRGDVLEVVWSFNLGEEERVQQACQILEVGHKYSINDDNARLGNEILKYVPQTEWKNVIDLMRQQEDATPWFALLMESLINNYQATDLAYEYIEHALTIETVDFETGLNMCHSLREILYKRQLQVEILALTNQLLATPHLHEEVASRVRNLADLAYQSIQSVFTNKAVDLKTRLNMCHTLQTILDKRQLQVEILFLTKQLLAIPNLHEEIVSRVRSLVKTLTNQGWTYTDSPFLAQQLVSHPQVNWIIKGCHLIQRLIQGGQYYQEALKHAQDFAKTTNPDLWHEACKISESLVKKGQLYAENIDLIDQLVEREEMSSYKSVCNIVESVVSQGQCYSAAIGVIQKVFNRKRSIEKEFLLFKQAFSIVKLLLEKKQAYSEITSLVRKWVNEIYSALDNNPSLYESSEIFPMVLFDILINLVEQGYAYKETLDFSKLLVNSFIYKPLGCDLMKALVNQGQAYAEAIDYVRQLGHEKSMRDYINKKEGDYSDLGWRIDAKAYYLIEALASQNKKNGAIANLI